jgi:hypothetical protein
VPFDLVLLKLRRFCSHCRFSILLRSGSRVQLLPGSICVEHARFSSLRFLQPPDSRLMFSKCLAMLPWWILGHTHEVFDEMYVR